MSNKILNTIMEYVESKKDDDSFNENEYLISMDILKEAHQLYLTKKNTDILAVYNINTSIKVDSKVDSRGIELLRIINKKVGIEQDVYTFIYGIENHEHTLDKCKFQEFLKMFLNSLVISTKSVIIENYGIPIEMNLNDYMKIDSLEEVEDIDEYYNEFCWDDKNNARLGFAMYIYNMLQVVL